jgi:hypothetical protein
MTLNAGNNGKCSRGKDGQLSSSLGVRWILPSTKPSSRSGGKLSSRTLSLWPPLSEAGQATLKELRVPLRNIADWLWRSRANADRYFHFNTHTIAVTASPQENCIEVNWLTFVSLKLVTQCPPGNQDACLTIRYCIGPRTIVTVSHQASTEFYVFRELGKLLWKTARFHPYIHGDFKAPIAGIIKRTPAEKSITVFVLPPSGYDISGRLQNQPIMACDTSSPAIH